jgi:precorrin-2 dehydrogenase/sirohydrochlorin ferrochelatase
MFMKLEGRPCLVVGAGTIGEPKISSLIAAGASTRVIALNATAAVAEWARAGSITWERRAFEFADLDVVFMVIAATNSRELNAAIFNAARQRNILCNVVDDPEYCDFYYPAVVRRGDLQLAISTNGQSPALAQRIRRELEIQFGPEYGEWLEQLGKIRQQLFASRMNPEERRQLLHELASSAAFEEARAAGFNIELMSLEKIS